MESLFDPVMQAGFAGLCLLMMVAQFWIIKKLFSMWSNDLRHIKTVIDGLPCRQGKCPEENKP